MNIHTLKSWRFWVVLSFLALTATLPVAFYLKTYDSVTIKYTIMQLGALLALAAWLAGGIYEERFEIPARTLPFVVPAVGLFVWNIARFLTTPYRIAAFDGFIIQEIFLLSFMLVLLSFSTKNLKQLILTAAGGWAVTVLYGLVQHFGLDPFIWKGAFGQNIFSTIGNPDFFAAYLVVSSPFAFMIVADISMPAPLRISAGILSVISGMVIVLTGAFPEMIIYLAMSAGFIALALNRMDPSDPKQAILATILATAICLTAFAYYAPKPTLFSSTGPLTAEIRRASFEMAKKAGWSGFGPGSFWIHYPSFRSQKEILLHHKHNIETDHAGNELLEQWIEGGLLGLFLWLAIFGITLYKGFKASALREFSSYTRGLLVSVCGSLAVSMIALNSPRNLSLGWLMYFNAGLLALLAANDDPGKAEKVLAIPVPSGPFRRFLVIVVIAVGCLAAHFALLMFRSDIYHNYGIFYSKNDKWDEAIAAYSKELPGSRSYLMGQYFLGNIFQDRGKPGDLEKSVEQYRKVRRMAPDYVQVHFQEAKALQRLNRMPEAITRMERQVQIDPVCEDAWLTLGGLYRKTGDTDKAKSAEQKAKTAKALWETQPAFKQ